MTGSKLHQPRASAPDSVPAAVTLANVSSDRRVLFLDACVLSMDSDIGDLPRADVLVVGDTIANVGPDLRALLAADVQSVEAPPTLVVDASDSVLIPGFVDTHRHMWQAQLRRLIPNVDIPAYLGLRNAFAVEYRPEDSYAGTLVSAWGALSNGVTTVLDLSHNTRSTNHADASVDALDESGIRAVFAYAPPEAGEWDQQWPDDLARVHGRIREKASSLSLRMAQRCFSERDNLTPERIQLARDLGIGMAVDPVAWEEGSARILDLAGSDSLGPDLVFVHCAALSGDAWSAMAAAGVRVSLSPFVDELLGFNPDGLPSVQCALDVGINPGISVDIETTVPGDMFTQMRALLAVQRMRALGHPDLGRDQITARQALAFATIHGAETIGLAEVCGSIRPGKKADIVMLDMRGVNGFPFNNAYGSVVMGADPGAIACVMASGVIKRWGDRLVGVETPNLRNLAESSRDYLAAKVGYEIDVFVDYPTMDLGPRKYRP